jgi:hypothetical protein
MFFKNLALYKRSCGIVSIYVTLQDDSTAFFEGTREEAKILMTSWSGKPEIVIFPRDHSGVNPLNTITFI